MAETLTRKLKWRGDFALSCNQSSRAVQEGMLLFHLSVVFFPLTDYCQRRPVVCTNGRLLELGVQGPEGFAAVIQ